MNAELIFVYLIPLFGVPFLLMVFIHHYLVPELMDLCIIARDKYLNWLKKHALDE